MLLRPLQVAPAMPLGHPMLLPSQSAPGSSHPAQSVAWDRTLGFRVSREHLEAKVDFRIPLTLQWEDLWHGTFPCYFTFELCRSKSKTLVAGAAGEDADDGCVPSCCPAPLPTPTPTPSSITR